MVDVVHRICGGPRAATRWPWLAGGMRPIALCAERLPPIVSVDRPGNVCICQDHYYSPILHCPILHCDKRGTVLSVLLVLEFELVLVFA